MPLGEFQTALLPLVGGLVVAIVFGLFLRETGTVAAKRVFPSSGTVLPRVLSA